MFRIAASKGTLPALKKALMQSTSRWSTLHIWVCRREDRRQIHPGLDSLWASDMAVHLKNSVLLLGKKEVPLWRPGTQTQLLLRTMTIDGVMPTWCGRIVSARLKGPLDLMNNLVEPSLKSAQCGAGRPRTLD
jgi:hypothetical protein